MLGGFLRLVPTEGSWLVRCKRHWLIYASRKDESGGRSSRLLPCSMLMCKKGVRQTWGVLVNMYPNPWLSPDDNLYQVRPW